MNWRYLTMGEGALLAQPQDGADEANRLVHALAAELASSPVRGLDVPVPGAASLLVAFDVSVIDRAGVEQALRAAVSRLAGQPHHAPRMHTFPVRYGGADGPDLAAVAATLGCSEAEVVALHCAPTYRVLLLGFAPGFPYLGGLPSPLRLPRRSEPRVSVPAGSVAVAAEYSGIYPAVLPGGWHLLGRCEAVLFDPRAEPPALLAPGDHVRFEPLPGGVVP